MNTGAIEKNVLEIACGTGRITLRLAQAGANITGLDLSNEMLEIALRKSAGMANVQWVRGDMRTFEIEKRFGLVIIPGHSFQFMLTPDDQMACLKRARHHLAPEGILAIHLDHQDFNWLAGLLVEQETVFEAGAVITHPVTGTKIRPAHAWRFEPSTQTATVWSKWEFLGPDGEVIETREMAPRAMHCVFRFEMEHLFRRAGFSIEAVYGDFYKNELNDLSKSMVWVARYKAPEPW